MSELLKIMSKFEDKSIDEVELNDLTTLQYILENLPNDIQYTIKGEDITIANYVYDRNNEFLSVDDSAYDAIEGKCFYCEESGTILKVIYVLKGDEVDNYHFHKYEFIYEQFEQYQDNTWHHKDYIWLQDTSDDEIYKKYAKLSSVAECNVGAENMYHLGKDGNLYVDYSCGGDYYIYKPCRESKFIAAKEEAFDNDGEYMEDE